MSISDFFIRKSPRHKLLNEQRGDSLYLQLSVQSGCSVRRLFSTVSRPMDNADPRPTNCQRTKEKQCQSWHILNNDMLHKTWVTRFQFCSFYTCIPLHFVWKQESMGQLEYNIKQEFKSSEQCGHIHIHLNFMLNKRVSILEQWIFLMFLLSLTSPITAMGDAPIALATLCSTR